MSRFESSPLTLALSPPSGERGQSPPPSPIRGEGRRWRTLLFAAFLTTTFLALDAHACAVCWGAPDHPLVKGANMGIWVLLGIVAFVQAGFIALFWSFWKRGRDQQRFRESLRVIHQFDPVDTSLEPTLHPANSPIHGGPQS